MIYLYDDLESFTSQSMEEAFETLPDWRKEKVLSYKFELDRKLCTLGYVLLMKGLRNEYSISSKPSFRYESHSKPYLQGFSEIFFNISHCKRGVVCILGEKEKGIDIEAIDVLDKSIVRFVCNDKEYDRILNSSAPEVEFCLLWTKKESLLKCTGEGISGDLKNLLLKRENDFLFESTVNLEKGYVITVCKKNMYDKN